MLIIENLDTRNAAVSFVAKVLISRSEHHNMVGTEVIHLQTIHQYMQDNPALLAEFSQIVKDGAVSFAMMGFVPVIGVEVDLKKMTLTIEVEDVSSSK